MPDRQLRLQPLVCSVSPFEAQVLAARLGADGVVWQLRGADPVYPVGSVDVLVAEADLGRARELLLADEVEWAFDDEHPDADDDSRRVEWVFGAVLVAVTLSFLLVRLLTL